MKITVKFFNPTTKLLCLCHRPTERQSISSNQPCWYSLLLPTLWAINTTWDYTVLLSFMCAYGWLCNIWGNYGIFSISWCDLFHSFFSLASVMIYGTMCLNCTTCAAAHTASQFHGLFWCVIASGKLKKCLIWSWHTYCQINRKWVKFIWGHSLCQVIFT